MLKNICLIFFSIALNLAAYVNIYPVSFDKAIDGKGSGQEFTLYNKTNKALRYNISLSDDRFQTNSMKNWVEFYPKNITVKPGKSEKIKMYIKAPKNTPKGEYLATVEIKENILPNLEKKVSQNNIQLLTHLKMDIVGYVGNLKPIYKIDNFSYNIQENTLSVKGTIKNSGDRRGRVALILSNGKNKYNYKLGNLKLNKGESINISKLSHNIKDQKLPKNFNKLILKDEDSGHILSEISL
ncbi:hypothetical protein NON08_00100 [Cetobacterium somerae]|uniref:COG1470 family protein n=1 Tax=Cetobacterium sp. NK01 TaxID=2993530 RepID=UPI002115FEBD|nr:hypothetical protein [Cetobacterium sp. NK01]MCQ8210972.1 hypothetical protein [Cetobacterium sp. NK01]